MRMKDIDRTAGRFDIDLAGHGRREGMFGLRTGDVIALRSMALLCNCRVGIGDRAAERTRRVARRRPLIKAVVDALFRRVFLCISFTYLF
jgi:hypothetical protein